MRLGEGATSGRVSFAVMDGLVPSIHVNSTSAYGLVGGRDEPVQDDLWLRPGPEKQSFLLPRTALPVSDTAAAPQTADVTKRHIPPYPCHQSVAQAN